MRFVLVGDDFPCAQVLDILLTSPECTVSSVFTNLDAPSSGMVVQKARREGTAVEDSSTLRRPSAASLLRDLDYDWLINVNSTVLMPGAVLETAKAGALNMHPGLLPEYGGLHTHQWAIMNGEEVFGATVHYMVAKLDAGRVLKRVEVPVEDDDTGLKLFMKCVRAGTDAMTEVVADIVAGNVRQGEEQDLSRHHVYRVRDLPDGHIDWSAHARDIERLVRAGNYEPFSSPSFTAHFSAEDGTVYELLRCKVVKTELEGTVKPATVIRRSEDGTPVVACGDGTAIALIRLRLKGEMTAMTQVPDLGARLH